MGCGQSKIHLYPRKSKSKANGKKGGHADSDAETDEDEGHLDGDTEKAQNRERGSGGADRDKHHDDHHHHHLHHADDPSNKDTTDGGGGLGGGGVGSGNSADDEVSVSLLRAKNLSLLQSQEISTSQQNFFRMLDKKIEEGPDYDSASETEIALEEARLNALVQHWESASLTASICSSASRSLQTTPVRQQTPLKPSATALQSRAGILLPGPMQSLLVAATPQSTAPTAAAAASAPVTAAQQMQLLQQQVQVQVLNSELLPHHGVQQQQAQQLTASTFKMVQSQQQQQQQLLLQQHHHHHQQQQQQQQQTGFKMLHQMQAALMQQSPQLGGGSALSQDNATAVVATTANTSNALLLQATTVQQQQQQQQQQYTHFLGPSGAQLMAAGPNTGIGAKLSSSPKRLIDARILMSPGPQVKQQQYAGTSASGPTATYVNGGGRPGQQGMQLAYYGPSAQQQFQQFSQQQQYEMEQLELQQQQQTQPLNPPQQQPPAPPQQQQQQQPPLSQNQAYYGDVIHTVQQAPVEYRFPPAISVQRLAPQVQRQLRETQELIKDSCQLYAAGYGSPGPPTRNPNRAMAANPNAPNATAAAQAQAQAQAQAAARRPPTLETQFSQELS